MTERMVQLVLHYDGAGFAGWQRQSSERTVQGTLEASLAKLCDTPVAALGAGRTDAGVHARGQAVGVRLPEKWDAVALRRALNAVLPPDVWVARSFEMHSAFHARYSALTRRYAYYLGTDECANSPFRRRWEWALARGGAGDERLSRSLLDRSAAAVCGEHSFRGFAVQGTAPASDDHKCTVLHSAWRDRRGGLVYEIEANRFLHHMVRFLVGTMVDIAASRRPPEDIDTLLTADDNKRASPPAPAHALVLDAVRYPDDLYVTNT